MPDKTEEAPVTKNVTVLDQLREELHKEVDNPNIDIPVLKRPGLVLRVSPNIDSTRYNTWVERSSSGSTRTADPKVDMVNLACNVIADRTIAIFWNDELVTGENGREVTFASPEMVELTGAKKPVDRVQALLGNDIHILKTFDLIMGAAGQDDEVRSLSREDEAAPLGS